MMPRSPELSPRQEQVRRLIARGLTYQEIGDELEISKRTVEKHAEILRRKVGARNNAALVSRARGRADSGPDQPTT